MAASASASASSSSSLSDFETALKNHQIQRAKVPTDIKLNDYFIDSSDKKYLIKSLSKPIAKKIIGYEIVNPRYAFRSLSRINYCMHVDGSFIGGVRGGFGIVLREYDGTFVIAWYGCFTMPYPTLPQAESSTYHELEAALLGIRFCKAEGIDTTTVRLVTDCQTVENIFVEDESIPSYGKAVERLCLKFPELMRPFRKNVESLFSVKREANWPADILSKLAMDCGSLKLAITRDTLGQDTYATFKFFLEEDKKRKYIRKIGGCDDYSDDEVDE